MAFVPQSKFKWIAIIGLFTSAAASLTLGWMFGGGFLLLTLCSLVARRTWLHKHPSREELSGESKQTATERLRKHLAANQTASSDQSLVEGMLSQKRYALLLRKQIVENLSQEEFNQTIEQLSEAMAILPEGEVMLGADSRSDSNDLFGDAISNPVNKILRVGGAYLDRHPVTNAEFFQFIQGGGYEQMAIWDQEIWPGVLNFVDLTGESGPRLWSDGIFAEGEENLPVVGVSWFEARAYARWVGKRLPTDAEWVKAGSWPVKLANSTGGRIQRRYPWGDTLDRRRCNLWGSGPDRIVDIEEFADGVSAGGVYQLIGNVWEWTSSNFSENNLIHGQINLPMPMRTIRGGAFDTYFDNQSTCQFQSGENPAARKHNIGFRCAISLCDLTTNYVAIADSQPVAEAETSTEEVAV